MDADVNNKLKELLEWVREAHKKALDEYKAAYVGSDEENYYDGKRAAFDKVYTKLKSMI